MPVCVYLDNTFVVHRILNSGASIIGAVIYQGGYVSHLTHIKFLIAQIIY